jgi:hypothetical protein
MPEALKTAQDLEDENTQWVWVPSEEDAFVPARVVQILAANNVRMHAAIALRLRPPFRR